MTPAAAVSQAYPFRLPRRSTGAEVLCGADDVDDDGRERHGDKAAGRAEQSPGRSEGGWTTAAVLPRSGPRQHPGLQRRRHQRNQDDAKPPKQPQHGGRCRTNDQNAQL